MELADARSLSPQTQQALRQRAVAAVVEQGRTQQQVARELGVARATVKRWVQRERARGEPALAARKQGRPPHPNWERAQVAQLAQLTQLIRDYAPEQLQLPYPLWTLEAVAELIRQQCGQQLSRQAVSNYLHAWGRSPQKPAKRAREQCPLRRSRLDGAPVPSPAAAGSAGGRPNSRLATRWACARTIRPAPAGPPRARLRS